MARKHAIVIGSSMGGLMAARALSDHFEEVTVLERDTLPAGPEVRRGVPQGRHAHGLLAGGRQEVEHCFPGITRELIGAGAIAGDVVAAGRWFFEGGCLAQVPSGLDGVAMSRPFLEMRVRQRLLKLGNVCLRQDCQVDDLDWDGSTVVGVKSKGEMIPADLVVDATGRGSRVPQWLQSAGFPAPQEERVEVKLAYTTRQFRRDPSDMGGDLAAVIPPPPDTKRGGVMLAQEGDRWVVTLIGHFGQVAPDDLDGFIGYAKSLPAPYIYEVISRAQPLGDAYGARMPYSVRRRYERLKRFPKGLLVVGDAICSFNPIYGQGMTVAAFEGRVLNQALRDGSNSNLAARFFASAATAVDSPWTIAVGNDLRMPETTGPRNLGVSIINWYLSKLHSKAHHDGELSLAFHRVANLLAPPPSLLSPKYAARVFFGTRANLHKTQHFQRANP
jgi:2-polyprenyl-6-methoxyphenol hydroxylase-like FAD-dependent oxidoreductase